MHARIAEAAVLAGEPERALRETELAELSGESDHRPHFARCSHRVRGYAYAQLRRRDDAAREFEQSVEAAREGDALYELALSLRARGDPPRGVAWMTARRSASSTRCRSSTLPDVPTG